MKIKSLFVRTSLTVSLLMLVSVIISACGAQPAFIKASGNAQTTFTPTSLTAQDCSYGGELYSVEAVDANTVRFRLCNSDPAFLQKLTLPVFSVMSRAQLNQTGGNSVEISKHPVGTGPYQLSSWQKGEYINLVRNKLYWGPAARNTIFTLKWAAQGTARYAAVAARLADGADNPDPSDFRTISNDPKVRIYSRPALNLIYIGMKSNTKPFDNLQIRQAISQSIDRTFLVNSFFNPGTEIADQVVPSNLTTGFTRSISWYPYNSFLAFETLNAEKYDFNQTLDLYYSSDPQTYMFNPAVVARKIQVDLMAAGFKVNLLSLPGDEFRTAVDSGKLAFYLDEVDADIADPSNFYDRLFLARERFLGDPDGDIQAAVRKASTTADSSSRKVYYDTANKLIYQKAAIVPIAHASNATIFRDIVDNVSVGPTAENFPDMSTLPGSMTFIQTFEPKSLNPGDEVNRDDMRIARLLYDTLVINEPGGTAIQPSLAESWSTNTEMTDWTFNLRYDVRFTDGKVLDANDVVATFDALWNASSINHEGRTGEFTLFKRLFGGFINAK